MIIPERVHRQGGIVPAFKVDDHLAEEVLKHKWCSDGDGYLVAPQKGAKSIRLHRFVWGLAYGHCPELIDHINQDRLDNRLCNLRQASPSQNGHNSKPYKKKSGLPMGVSWSKARGKYLAQISMCGRNFNLGRFSTPEEAEAAYLAAKSAVLGIS